MLTHQSSSLNVNAWPRLPFGAVIQTDPYQCLLRVTCLGERAGTAKETAFAKVAIYKLGELLEDQEEQGVRKASDSKQVVADIGLALETTLRQSLDISLAIESMDVLYVWMDLYGSRDISAIISCEGTILAKLWIVFLKKELETTGCLLPLNPTSSR